MNKSIYLALSLSVAISAPSTAEGLRDRLCDKHLLSVSPDGSVTRGSKAAIVEAVESGKSIRVGFGLGPGRGVDGDFSLTHWFNPSFMTVLGGEVFTQTPIIHSQRPVRPAYDVDFPDAGWAPLGQMANFIPKVCLMTKLLISRFTAGGVWLNRASIMPQQGGGLC